MNYKEEYIKANGIKLHYIEYEGDGPTLVLMHGLTANAHAFDGLVAAGLCPDFRLISVDLRGRGLSDHPSSGYSVKEHAKDIVALLDKLNIHRAFIGGHSFGGLLSYYLGYHHPRRINKLILMDAAARMHPKTSEMLVPAMSRLGKTFTSFQEYLHKIKTSPYMDSWEESMLSYYNADVIEMPDGSVTPRSSIENITKSVKNILREPWEQYLRRIHQPSILINAMGNYNMDAQLLPTANARATAEVMPDCQYIQVPGNHQTMLYGEGARQIVTALRDFFEDEL